MTKYACRLFCYNHTHGENVERERNSWRAFPLEPFAEVEVSGANARDAAAFAYVLTVGIDKALVLRSMNAQQFNIRNELDIAAMASSLVEEQCWAGPCLLLDWNPCELFYMIVQDGSDHPVGATGQLAR